MPISRENIIGGSCSAFDDLEITVDATAGPFVLTYPNDPLSWTIGETVIITWEVAKTDITPINTTEVNIYLSTDGGLTSFSKSLFITFGINYSSPDFFSLLILSKT